MSAALLTDALSAPEDTLRPDQENQNQDDECRGVLEVARQYEVRQLDDQTDDHGAGEGAEGGSETAEGDRGKHQQQKLQAGLPVDTVQHQAEQHTRESGERSGRGPDQADDAVDV